MDAEKFVNSWKQEKDDMLKMYLAPNGESEVTALISKLNLSREQSEEIEALIDCLLTDSFYTLLLGLGGAGSIGGIQQNYTIIPEGGNPIEPGEIESKAWEHFHG